METGNPSTCRCFGFPSTLRQRQKYPKGVFWLQCVFLILWIKHFHVLKEMKLWTLLKQISGNSFCVAVGFFKEKSIVNNTGRKQPAISCCCKLSAALPTQSHLTGGVILPRKMSLQWQIQPTAERSYSPSSVLSHTWTVTFWCLINVTKNCEKKQLQYQQSHRGQGHSAFFPFTWIFWHFPWDVMTGQCHWHYCTCLVSTNRDLFSLSPFMDKKRIHVQLTQSWELAAGPHWRICTKQLDWPTL